jgi:hypothetical protein
MFEMSERCFNEDEDRIYLTNYIMLKLCDEDHKWYDFPDSHHVRENKIFGSVYNKINYQLNINREILNGKI